MKLIPTTLDQIFYLYCALIYNGNTTVRLPSPQLGVAEKIKQVLKDKNFEEISMPDHRYQYLLSLLEFHCENKNVRDAHNRIIAYIEKLSKVEELEGLLDTERKQVEEHLGLYGSTFEKVTALFRDTFDFDSPYANIYVTRNFGKSGMFIPLNTEGYLILGNVSYWPNTRNLIHELLHAQLEKVDIKITRDIEDIIAKFPDEINRNYKKTYTILEESLVRALVVYLTHKSRDFEPEELSEQDEELVLSKLFLEVLERDNRDTFSVECLEGVGLGL